MKIEIPDEFFTEEELKNTPKRWNRFIKEWTVTSKKFKFTRFPNEPRSHEIIVESPIPIYSMCSHHLLPFMGVAHVGYLPDKWLPGLSKIPRLLDSLAQRPNQQEHLTTKIADALVEEIQPDGVMVVISSRHMCMEMRGVKKPCVNTITSALRGIFKTDPTVKMEFFELVRLGRI